MIGKLITLALFSAVLMAPGVALGAPLEKKGSTSYTSHYVFRPLGTTELSGVGKVSALEMVGTTENTKGEPAFDKIESQVPRRESRGRRPDVLRRRLRHDRRRRRHSVLDLQYARPRQVAAEDGLRHAFHKGRQQQVHRESPRARAILLHFEGDTARRAGRLIRV